MTMKPMLDRTLKIAANVVLYVAAGLFIFPLYWMATGSFKNQTSSLKFPPELFPSSPVLANYRNLIKAGDVFYWLFNSVFVSTVASFLICLICAMAGYALTKRKFAGASAAFGIIVIAMFIPKQITLVPLFSMMRGLGLVNHLSSVILPLLALPFGVFLMKQFSQAVPTELLEAGKIDGCTEIGLFFRIFLPIVKPATGALAIFAFTTVWNDYLWQLIMLSGPHKMTINVGISSLISEYNAQYGLQMAAATIGFIPVFIVFIAFQKHFVKGITLGGVKG
ncbi:carbohydrate ABC transporter permease [Paenibacillus lycopersici]|uniref:Carbohydrate ABC transporter permease n=1 Tax=Paenibacillus lycopersici TaxID=2704462 RepID=A0A6C0G4A2_9BACL|nr:carbohydrate ABC transporter permease [Paenibacillus lycopersici]QHT59665.1 carbohydrate ABC transporter permease [Paenibacillus lycopersici]